jgi:hypothetical protein
MNTYRYTVGGSLTLDDPTYIVRPADEELLQVLKSSQSCYILNSKQMGKSSLVIRSIKEIETDKNVICILVDLQRISSNTSEEKWYESFVSQIMDDRKIPDFDWEEKWDSLKGDSLAKLKILLNKILELTNKKHLILMLDEIDHLRLLNFNIDSLFNYIRYCHNYYRANTSEPHRVTFCLIGTGNPSDFIEDNYTISFNIGEKIEIRGLEFNQEAIDRLSPGLVEKFKNDNTLAELTLKEIFNWTNGQPFLTQLLCDKICKLSEKPDSEHDVERFVKNCIDQYLEKWLKQYQEHRNFIETRIKKTKAKSIRILERYKDILEKKVISADLNYNDEDMELRLSGLVITTEDGEHLQPFNRIYEKIFGLDWVNKQLEEEIAVRPYADKFNAWLQAKEEIKDHYLLYGIELETAQIWQKENPKKLINEDISFLKDSENFCKTVKSSFPENCDYQAFIEILCSWTGGINLLNEIMCQFAKDKRLSDPENGKEKIWFKDKLVPKLKSNEKVKKHIQELSDRLLKDPNIDPSLLLSSYQEILEQEEVEFNHSPEHQKLIDMCLGVREDGKLKILGKIYRLIFDQKWVKEQLSRLCPYAKEFKAWQASDCQDESLLKGEDLQTAINWIQNKDKLSEPELEFIITSLAWEMWPSDDTVQKVKEFLPQLQEKTQTLAHLVRVIQAILDGTRPQLILLQDVLQWVRDAEVIPTEDEAKWLEEVVRSLTERYLFKEFLASSIVAYEKAILDDTGSSAKTFIDKVFYKLVEIFLNSYENQDTKFDTIEDCIKHLSDTLIELQIWNEAEKPIIHPDTENILRLQVLNCSYKQECQWALDQTEFTENGNYETYRCQRLGCCVGAVKKYMSEEFLPETDRNKLTYSMETVMDPHAGCQGYIKIGKHK